MTSTTAITTPAPEAGTDYCDCARSGDLWRCQNPGAKCRSDGKGCALTATLNVSGRDYWDGTVEAKLSRTPCPCGRPRKS